MISFLCDKKIAQQCKIIQKGLKPTIQKDLDRTSARFDNE